MSSPCRVKETMGFDGNLHKRIASFAFSPRGRALPAQPEDLSVFNPRGNRHMQGSSMRQGDHLGRAIDCVEKPDRKAEMQIRARRAPQEPRKLAERQCAAGREPFQHAVQAALSRWHPGEPNL